MSILVDKNTRVLVQGLTGREGRFHTEQMQAYGTTVVAGCTPGKGGQTVLGVPVFNTVAKAVRETGADVSVVFVPASVAADAVCEATGATKLLFHCCHNVTKAEFVSGATYLSLMQANVETLRKALN